MSAALAKKKTSFLSQLRTELTLSLVNGCNNFIFCYILVQQYSKQPESSFTRILYRFFHPPSSLQNQDKALQNVKDFS